MLKSTGETQLEQRLLTVYKERGLTSFLNVCASMLNIKSGDNWEKKKKVNGAVCEIVLFVMTMHFLKQQGIVGRSFHSMILSDLDNPKSKFRTELDFTLLTPGLCLTGECKSLVGDITVTGDCLLTRKDFQADVGKQSTLHARTLRRYLCEYGKTPQSRQAPPFGMFCFVYSNGTISDLRTSQAKQTIPVLTLTSLFPYYERMCARFSKEVFDYSKASKAFASYSSSEALYQEHRTFLGY